MAEFEPTDEELDMYFEEYQQELQKYDPNEYDDDLEIIDQSDVKNQNEFNWANYIYEEENEEGAYFSEDDRPTRRDWIKYKKASKGKGGVPKTVPERLQKDFEEMQN